MLFSPKFTLGMVAYLHEMIADHFSMISELYVDEVTGIPLKPKHHVIIHFPTIIMQSGPLVGMSCMHYEFKKFL